MLLDPYARTLLLANAVHGEPYPFDAGCSSSLVRQKRSEGISKRRRGLPAGDEQQAPSGFAQTDIQSPRYAIMNWKDAREITNFPFNRCNMLKSTICPVLDDTHYFC